MGIEFSGEGGGWRDRRFGGREMRRRWRYFCTGVWGGDTFVLDSEDWGQLNGRFYLELNLFGRRCCIEPYALCTRIDLLEGTLTDSMTAEMLKGVQELQLNWYM